jgi:hypothetical protein
MVRQGHNGLSTWERIFPFQLHNFAFVASATHFPLAFAFGNSHFSDTVKTFYQQRSQAQTCRRRY